MQMENKNQFSQSILDSYYHRFYQGRKSNKPKKKDKDSEINLIPQKQNLIFNINYQTNTSPSKPKSQYDHFNPSQSLDLQKNTSISKNQQSKTLTKSNTKHSTLIPPKNSLILQINIPNLPQKIIKIKNKSRQSPSKQSYKLQNFDHFPSQNISIKNRPHKNQNTKNHFIKVHNYSKTIDFDNWNPQNSFHNQNKTIQTSPQKENQFFTLENFSYIKLHNDKKNPKPLKKKEIIDIVKRKQMSQSLKFNVSQQNCRKRSLTNNIKVEQTNSPKMKQFIQRDQSSSKKALFNEFKPTIQLKKRPSTGIPMKRHKGSQLIIENDQRNESPNHKLNYSVHNRYNNTNSPNKNSQINDTKKHSRTSSLKLQSSRRIQVKTREIQTLKYVDLSESQKMKDFFRNSEDINSKQLKNIVRLQFHRKNSLIHKKNTKNKRIMQEEEFLPWQSVQKDDEIIEIIN